MSSGNSLKFTEFLDIAQQNDKDDYYWRERIITDFSDLVWADPKIEYIRHYTKSVENSAISKYYKFTDITPESVRKLVEYFATSSSILYSFNVTRQYDVLYAYSNAIGPNHAIEQIKRSKNYTPRNFDLIFHRTIQRELFVFLVLGNNFIQLQTEHIPITLHYYFKIFIPGVTITDIKNWYGLNERFDYTKPPVRPIQIDSK